MTYYSNYDTMDIDYCMLKQTHIHAAWITVNVDPFTPIPRGDGASAVPIGAMLKCDISK